MVFTRVAVAALVLLAESATTLATSSHASRHSRHQSHNKRRFDTSVDFPKSQLQSRADPVLPTGWSLVGCTADSSSRTLSIQSNPNNGAAVTQGSCVASCNSLGYSYAGIEYGWECWCGNSILNSAASLPDSSCSMACSGDSSQKCGGNWSMTLFKKAGTTTTTPTTSWTALGCFIDDSNRVLPTAGNVDTSTQTIEKCQALCTSKSMPYAGLEVGSECWCGSSLSATALSDSSTCSSTCTGNSGQTCGGAWRMNIFRSSSATTTATTTSTSATSTSTGSWSSVGCFVDDSNRLLATVGNVDTSAQTVEKCQAICAAKSMPYAGLETGSECWCGSSLSASALSDSSTCSSTCTGNSGQKCGGAWRLNVYKSSSITATATTTTSTATSTANAYASIGCYVDSATRTLSTTGNTDTTGQTLQKCFTICAAKSMPFAGLETGSECWCGSYLTATALSDSSTCNVACTGNSAQMCGGAWRLNIYKNPAYATTTPPTTTATGTASGPTQTGAWWTGNGGSGKLVVAHFMMGNCYSYDNNMWIQQFTLAKAQGIDAFALNMGNDDYIRGQTANAFNNAAAVGFKLFFSFDITAMGCASNDQANNIRGYIAQYNTNSAYLKDSQGRAIVSTFAGEYCYFGRGSVNDGWNYAVKEGFNTNFIPSFFADPASFNGLIPARDGDFYWNGGWPLGNYDVRWDEDAYHLNYNSGKTYMTSISPAFFTHYGPDTWNKNWIYRGDSHLYPSRWEMLVNRRSSVDIVQIVTWNDYGESSYVGPIGAATDQPRSNAWVDGFDHTPFLEMTGYYVSAFKSGSYPTVTQDKIFMWSRPHPCGATASSDNVGRPDHWDWTGDDMWVTLFAKSSGTLTVTAGGQSGTFQVNAGANHVKVPSGGSPSARLVRNGSQVFNYAPSVFQYTNSPQTYNFNYFIAAGP